MQRVFVRCVVPISLGISALAAPRLHTQSKVRECPTVPIDTSEWATTIDHDVGIEIKHPLIYREKHWESRSDSSGVTVAFWRDAVNTVDLTDVRTASQPIFREISASTCRIATRSSTVDVRIVHTTRSLWDGRDTLHFVGRATIKPNRTTTILIQLGAQDSTELLKQVAMLRTMRYLPPR